ncbi:TolC family outer membrane protein [Inmirania thermothiophila]|nr:TolC family outer membrane protein [Inmirania thermothiophila]
MTWAFLAVPARAEDLLALYRQALAGEPSLKQAEAGLGASRAAARRARGALLPGVGLAAEYARQRQDFDGTPEEEFDESSIALSFTQPLFRRDRRIGLEQAGTEVARAEAELARARQELMVRVAERYFGVLAAEDDLELAVAEKKAIARQLEQARQRFEVGLIAITDVHEAQARFDQAVAGEIVARNRLDAAREALVEVTGPYRGPLRRPAETMPLLPPDPDDPERWAETALARNRGLEALRHAVAVAEAEVRKARAARLPAVDLTASVSRLDTGGFFGRTGETGSIGIQLTMPIYQGGQIPAGIEEAAQRLAAVRQQLEAARRQVARAARDAYRGVVASVSQVKALAQAVVSSESALEATEAGFEVGTRTVVDVLNAQRELFRARRDYRRARYDYLLNRLRLALAAGTLDEEVLGGISRLLQR